MHKIISLIIIAVFLGGASPVQETGDSPFRKKMNEFISIALENNPQLKESQNRIKQFKEVPSQAGSLDDPILRFELKNLPSDSFAFDQDPGTQKKISVSQKFPYPGKLMLRSEIAGKNVAIAEHSLEDLKLKIIKDVKTSYFELSFILASIQITRKNKDLLEQFVTIAETKYSVGKGIQQDVLKAQVELSKIIDELIRLNELKELEQARLNTLMDRLPQEPLSIPDGITHTPFTYNLVELQKLSEEFRPTLKEIRSLKERFQVSKRLAEKEYYPDFNVGFKYGQRENGLVQDRPDFVSAYVAINIPIWYKTKQRRKVAEESFKIMKIQEAYNDARNQIFLGIKELFEEEIREEQTIELIGKAIIPQARQSLESAVAGYGVDKVDFLTLLDNQITLFNWEIKYQRELASYEKTLANLESVVGKSLF
ncbi:MAG: TolC family protein [Nitrospinaceae bacterium]